MCNRCKMYDGKDTRRGKQVQCTLSFCRNVTIFAGHLSKSAGQLMLMNASDVKRALLVILFL
jgi:hypothetical protein